MNLLNPTEWGTSSSPNRYDLEKTAMVELDMAFRLSLWALAWPKEPGFGY